MDKNTVRLQIDTLLNSIQKEQETYAESLTRDEILEVRKSIRLRIKELNQKLAQLYKALEDLERG
ncbi:MAG: hypothetical protein JWM28_3601 [Chitinophagaceae bacterium]|nr:hypothetical protein [Chitinophagaceae bacterium]